MHRFNGWRNNKLFLLFSICCCWFLLWIYSLFFIHNCFIFYRHLNLSLGFFLIDRWWLNCLNHVNIWRCNIRIILLLRLLLNSVCQWNRLLRIGILLILLARLYDIRLWITIGLISCWLIEFLLRTIHFFFFLPQSKKKNYEKEYFIYVFINLFIYIYIFFVNT